MDASKNRKHPDVPAWAKIFLRGYIGHIKELPTDVQTEFLRAPIRVNAMWRNNVLKKLDPNCKMYRALSALAVCPHHAS